MKMLQKHTLTSTWFRARLRTQREHSCSRAPKARARKILGKSSIFTAKNALNQARNGFADLLPPPPPQTSDFWRSFPPPRPCWLGGILASPSPPPPRNPQFWGRKKTLFGVDDSSDVDEIDADPDDVDDFYAGDTVVDHHGGVDDVANIDASDGVDFDVAVHDGDADVNHVDVDVNDVDVDDGVDVPVVGDDIDDVESEDDVVIDVDMCDYFDVDDDVNGDSDVDVVYLRVSIFTELIHDESIENPRDCESDLRNDTNQLSTSQIGV